ncbi:MAG: CAP domain-containing protein [Clostridia bacterium]|nr:CAP domain-containing protein [Clostridia bacterium]
MTNINKIIITLLVVVMTLTACAVSEQPTDTAANASLNTAADITEQEPMPTRQTQSTNIKYATLEKTYSIKETAPITPTPTTTSKPPFENSSPIEEPPPPQDSAPIAEETSRPYLEMEQEAVRLVNLEREKVGLPPLETDDTYYNLVRLRAKESTEYWSHTRPNGQQWSSLYMELANANRIRKIAENLGKNFTTVERITECLMVSQSHRNAILGADYTHICIAIVLIEDGEDENRYAIAQHFYQKEE